MERIKIDFPETVHFTTEIAVRISDINYGNHAGNDAIVSMIHESRVQFLQKAGFTELDIDGLGLLMTDLAVQYKKQILYPGHLHFALSVKETSPKSFIMYYQVTFSDGSVAVLAQTTMLCFDYSAQKISNFPGSFFKRILNL
jgi:acyl-CoA thioesterase FadM